MLHAEASLRERPVEGVAGLGYPRGRTWSVSVAAARMGGKCSFRADHLSTNRVPAPSIKRQNAPFSPTA
jgi:hypothetical protein